MNCAAVNIIRPSTWPSSAASSRSPCRAGDAVSHRVAGHHRVPGDSGPSRRDRPQHAGARAGARRRAHCELGVLYPSPRRARHARRWAAARARRSRRTGSRAARLARASRLRARGGRPFLAVERPEQRRLHSRSGTSFRALRACSAARALTRSSRWDHRYRAPPRTHGLRYRFGCTSRRHAGPTARSHACSTATASFYRSRATPRRPWPSLAALRPQGLAVLSLLPQCSPASPATPRSPPFDGPHLVLNDLFVDPAQRRGGVGARCWRPPTPSRQPWGSAGPRSRRPGTTPAKGPLRSAGYVRDGAFPSLSLRFS